ncbi:hypothetical protein [Modestobacter sp. SYSU DS0875]
MDGTAAGWMTVIPFRNPWAEVLISNGQEFGSIPEYRSAEWAALPDNDRRKVAACVIAAERWATRHHLDVAFVERASARARRIAQARQPRDGDHPGGPVRWEARR